MIVELDMHELARIITALREDRLRFSVFHERRIEIETLIMKLEEIKANYVERLK